MKDPYVWDALRGIFRDKRDADPRFPKYTFIRDPEPEEDFDPRFDPPSKEKHFDPRFPRSCFTRLN